MDLATLWEKISGDVEKVDHRGLGCRFYSTNLIFYSLKQQNQLSEPQRPQLDVIF
ncbi:hypothetical protein HPP92_012846 [Vanilla planifolia]|uniref:Uncharacterized protein n=1 Tax=Vanilla planifolia TaxID=51239 RepID=A0A835UXF4_VANPL|nr:hypothetical protein HPP92_012846 [Vanilla planifolia]